MARLMASKHEGRWKDKLLVQTGETLEYLKMEEAWHDAVGWLLKAADYREDTDEYDQAAVFLAERKLAHYYKRSRAEIVLPARELLAALAYYGHPFVCDDAEYLQWCGGYCTADWRRYTWHAATDGHFYRGVCGQPLKKPIEWMEL